MALERVLVVDDDVGLRSLLALICRRAGYEVDVAKDGEEALRLIESTSYLLAVLDLQMPKVNGFDVIAKLRSRPRRPAIVVLTALPPAGLIGLDASVVQAVIRKPFDVDLLTSIITELANQSRAGWSQSAGEPDNIISFPGAASSGC